MKEEEKEEINWGERERRKYDDDGKKEIEDEEKKKELSESERRSPDSNEQAKLQVRETKWIWLNCEERKLIKNMKTDEYEMLVEN